MSKSVVYITISILANEAAGLFFREKKNKVLRGSQPSLVLERFGFFFLLHVQMPSVVRETCLNSQQTNNE